jgi:hypothetical protein
VRRGYSTSAEEIRNTWLHFELYINRSMEEHLQQLITAVHLFRIGYAAGVGIEGQGRFLSEGDTLTTTFVNKGRNDNARMVDSIHR